jgi:hypothetical protein
MGSVIHLFNHCIGLAAYIKVKDINLIERIKRETKVPGTFVSLFEKGGKYWIFTI